MVEGAALWAAIDLDMAWILDYFVSGHQVARVGCDNPDSRTNVGQAAR